MVEIEETKLKKNNLNTKFLPPVFMLVAGLVTLIICLLSQYDMRRLLLTVFLAMLAFAIIGTVIKTIADSFNMKMTYEDFLDDEGEIREKN